MGKTRHENDAGKVVSEIIRKSGGLENSPPEDMGDDAPTIKQFTLIIIDGVRQRAHLILIVPGKDFTTVHHVYHQDKALGAGLNRYFKISLHQRLVARIKTIANLQICATVAQRGAFKLLIGEERVFQVTITPTAFGEMAIIEIPQK